MPLLWFTHKTQAGNFWPAKIRAGWIRLQCGVETSLMWWHSITVTIQSVTTLSEAPSRTRFGSVTHTIHAFAAHSLARSLSHKWGLSSWWCPKARPRATWDGSAARQLWCTGTAALSDIPEAALESYTQGLEGFAAGAVTHPNTTRTHVHVSMVLWEFCILMPWLWHGLALCRSCR